MREGTFPSAVRRVMTTLVFMNAALSVARADDAPVHVASEESAASEANASRSTPEYESAIDAAVDEYERGNYEEAREHFREAHERYPNARTFRGVGKVEFELRNYGEAVRFLSASLSEQERPLSDGLRREVVLLLERARAYVGEVHVQVQPGSATVIVDGVTVANGPQADINLLVGDHVLEFRALGRLPERRQISVRGRDQIAVQVTLSSVETERASALNAPPSDVKPVYRKPWLWTTVGVVAAAGATLAVVLATRDNQHGPSGGTSGLALHTP